MDNKPRRDWSWIWLVVLVGGIYSCAKLNPVQSWEKSRVPPGEMQPGENTDVDYCDAYPERCVFEPDDSYSDVDDPENFGLSDDASGCPDGCETPPAGCSIKGNIAVDTGEKIYHVPGDTFYNETIIRPEYGEMWFCSEEEARANGWRRTYK